MLVREYEDFDEAYYSINKESLENPEIFDYVTGILGYIDNVFFRCESYDCTLDLSEFGYQKTKWTHLLGTYIDYDELLKFYEDIRKVSGLSYTYRFKTKNKNNGSCLLAVVLSRPDRKKNWTKVNVLYRTTEFTRRFAADLVLIHHFINELPQDICDINEVTFYFPQSYCSALVINGFWQYFDIDLDELDDEHTWVKSFFGVRERSFIDSSIEPSSYQAMARMQKLQWGELDTKEIDIEGLSIKEVFENKNKRRKKK